jgi:ribosome-binding protein aMBF1 (putative translation factor)
MVPPPAPSKSLSPTPTDTAHQWSSLAFALERLPEALKTARERRGLSVREASAEAGLDLPVWLRLESGSAVFLDRAVTALHWLEVSEVSSASDA